MNTPATYLHWTFVLISIPNLLLIVGMLVLFVAALLIPFPFGREPTDDEPPEARP